MIVTKEGGGDVAVVLALRSARDAGGAAGWAK